MEQIRLALVGPGLIGRVHSQLIQKNQSCHLQAVVAPDETCHREYVKTLPAPCSYYHSLQSCLNMEAIDGVIIASPNPFHADQAMECIQAGVPVLIEKPITDNLEDGYRVVEFAKEKNAKVMVGHHRAHSPILRRARQVITEGRLGQLVSITGSAQFFKPTDYFDAGPWRKERGGGPILINLIHEVGNFRSLCGEIVAVQAISSSRVRKFLVEDTVGINFLFENGVIGNFLLSDTAATGKSWEQTTGENPIFSHYNNEDCYNVTGTLGSLSIPTMRLRYFAKGVVPSWLNELSEDKLEVEQQNPLECQLEHFLDVISGKAVPLVSAADGFRNLQIVEAISQSTRTNQLVEV